jgi:hypothetical protein
VIKGDCAIGQIAFINADAISTEYNKKWLNQYFPLNKFDGTQINANNLRGKKLIVNCWSITCGFPNKKFCFQIF